jgi:hypothetical protein
VRDNRHSIKEAKYFFIVFVMNALVFVQDGRFDPDPHHDGLIFTGAVAASEGLIPNKDFFSQYGPLTPYLQGFFLDSTSANLLNLRIMMGLFSAINGAIVFLVVKRMSNQVLGIMISLLWVWQLSARIPWPSILSTTLILLSIVLVLEIRKSTNLVTQSKYRLIFGGYILGMLSFVRLHNVIFLVLILLFLVFRRFKNSGFLLVLLFGNFLGLISGALILILTGGFSEFIKQCVIWPIFRYGPVDVTKSYLVGLLWFPLITIASLIYVWLILRFVKTKKMTTKIFQWSLFTGFWVAIGFSYSIPREGYLSLRNPLVLYIDTSNNFVHFIGFFSVGIVVIYSITTVFRGFDKDNRIVIAIIGLGTLTQLYPLYDQVHMWFITPVLLVCASLFLQPDLNERIKSKQLLVAFVPFILILSFLAIQRWSTDSADFKSSILAGMKGNPNAVHQIDSTIKMLDSNLGGEKIVYDCENGIYAAYSGRYESTNRNYVNWAPDFSPAELGQKYFVCDVPASEYYFIKKDSSEVARVKYYSSGELFYNAILIRE